MLTAEIALTVEIVHDRRTDCALENSVYMPLYNGFTYWQRWMDKIYYFKVAPLGEECYAEHMAKLEVYTEGLEVS